MIFRLDRLYTLQEIESLANFEPTEWEQGYSVIDINGDHSQYDFVGDSDSLRLWAVDGALVESLAEDKRLRAIDAPELPGLE